ncbi:hypothetical protein GCM10009609_17520 [Pseudonocardia aurantiaca]
MRVLIVEDEPYLAEAIRDGLRLEAIIATVPGVGYRIDTERSLSERADDTERSLSERADDTTPDTGCQGGDRG